LRVYRPHRQTLPVILVLTPYTADEDHASGMFFARNGYVFAVADVRGRGSSTGTFDPAADGRDGHDVVEWIAAQPWSDGRVAMCGGSYEGATQWLTARERPRHLAAMAPTSPWQGTEAFPWKNAISVEDVRWLFGEVTGASANPRLWADSGFWLDALRELHASGRPLRDFDRLLGSPSQLLQTWLDHPAHDEYWRQFELSPEDYAQIDIPVLSITGQYDWDEIGTIGHFRRHLASAPDPEALRHHLIVGPWHHAGTENPERRFGGVEVGEKSLLDMKALHLAWYDWVLKDGPQPEFLEDRVAYYTIGSDEWRYARDIDAVQPEPRILYLDSQGGAGDVFHSGRLRATAPDEHGVDSFVYDPLDLSALELATTRDFETKNDGPYGFVDQKPAHLLNGAGLIYHSEPFEEKVEITGFPRVTLWLELDVPDADLMAFLSVVFPTGESVLLSEDLIRARFRHSLADERLAERGLVERYQFDGFRFVSRVLPKWSRLRLVVRCPSSAHWFRHYNSDKPMAEATAADARTARISLHHDPGRPSSLELPVRS
jgi:putative CocE/NonD family hydrolase